MIKLSWKPLLLFHIFLFLPICVSSFGSDPTQQKSVISPQSCTCFHVGTQICCAFAVVAVRNMLQLKSCLPVVASLIIRIFLHSCVPHLCLSLSPVTWHLSILESLCHYKGRGIPGRQHHHSTPLLNRPQKITTVFQSQQQPPIGFGQVRKWTDEQSSACVFLALYNKKHFFSL